MLDGVSGYNNNRRLFDDNEDVNQMDRAGAAEDDLPEYMRRAPSARSRQGDPSVSYEEPKPLAKDSQPWNQA
jgi:hypothetical protein